MIAGSSPAMTGRGNRFHRFVLIVAVRALRYTESMKIRIEYCTA